MSEPISRLFSAVSGLLATRFRLLGIELQEELERSIQLFLLVAAAAVFASMFLLLLTVLLLLLFWEQYRVVVTLVLILIYGGLATSCLLVVRRRLQQGRVPFSTTAREFEKDYQLVAGKTPTEEGA